MATFRFELNGRPTRNKTYVVYLRVTVSGKRKLIKTPIEVARPSDFNAKCKGENWVRGGVRDAKLLNAQLADILSKAKKTYKELDREGEVSTVLLAKEMNTEVVSPYFMAFARERAQMIYGSFDTAKTDETLRNVFTKKKMPAATDDSNKSKEEQAIELLKGLSPEQIMAVISAINK